MAKDIIIYECGLEIDGKYSEFCQSRNETDVDNYIKIMRECCYKGEIVKLKKHYSCICTTPLFREDIANG